MIGLVVSIALPSTVATWAEPLGFVTGSVLRADARASTLSSSSTSPQLAPSSAVDITAAHVTVAIGPERAFLMDYSFPGVSPGRRGTARGMARRDEIGERSRGRGVASYGNVIISISSASGK